MQTHGKILATKATEWTVDCGHAGAVDVRLKAGLLTFRQHFYAYIR